jgi:hypothetical protein
MLVDIAAGVRQRVRNGEHRANARDC